jgi:beta-lactam-binding protein with PASTA domain
VKEFFGKVFRNYIVRHLMAMALVVILLCVGVGIGLDYYTHHGEGIVVPDLKGMGYDKACRLLAERGLDIVVSDSGYSKLLPANSVLAQTPAFGQKVKQGRIVYVTINSPHSPTFAVPDIVDNSSVREAEARLQAMGFRLTAPLLIDGEKDWVYGILCQGRRISNGDRITMDYPLTLMVGKGTFDDADSILFVEPARESEVDEFVEVKDEALR